MEKEINDRNNGWLAILTRNNIVNKIKKYKYESKQCINDSNRQRK